MNVNLYKDWSQWTKNNAMIWLQSLDQYERSFCKASLKYHKIPHPVRHSLQSDRPRPQQSFFIIWFEIKNPVVDIINDFGYYQPLADDVEFLRSINGKFEQALAKLK
ncbi:hypothetical protein BDU57DRAFT_538261 [Ampelomyces quisqualis]|uniref:Uncharacterized protein n=1 Tax=Ampelomyces quisqualis TaxID=50730 RepID=A0A6A5QKB7_AMPQU|nr:hypothetical protein BDU57DRAFT_538261 [Ampelomyces quisqualis]